MGEVLVLLLLVVCLLIYFYFRDVTKWRQVVERIKEKYSALKNLYDEEKDRADIVRDNLTKAQKKIIELQAEIDTFNEVTSEFQDEINLLTEQLEGQKERYAAAKAEIEQAALEIPPLKAEIEEKDKEISRQQAHIDAFEDSATTPHGGERPLEGEESATPSNSSTIGITENSGAELEGWTQQCKLELDHLRDKSSAQQVTIRELELQLASSGQSRSQQGAADESLQQRLLSESETCINILETELDTMAQRVNELEEQLEKGEGGSNDPASESQVALLTQKLSESETCIGILESELDTMAEKITSLKAELKETTKTDRNDDEVSTGMGI
jgi:chromosome segregation ATPase